jgi:formyltetrahydrofolate-dependent phosphoribosylglycinamide formyltransferase
MRLVVLISGNGSNLQAILDACAGGDLSDEVVAVVSNRRKAFGLERARRADVPTVYEPLGRYRKAGKTRSEYDIALARGIRDLAPDLVVLAGWMHILSPEFLENLGAPVINLHPALPGAFPGTHAIERAHEAFGRGEITHTGVMVHEVVPEIDAGPTIRVTKIALRQGESIDALADRVHATEHQLLVDAIADISAGRYQPRPHRATSAPERNV